MEIIISISAVCAIVYAALWAKKALATEEVQRASYIKNAVKASNKAQNTLKDPANRAAIADLVARGKLDVKIK